MMGSVGGSTKSSRDASTQTPVHSETQTDDDITVHTHTHHSMTMSFFSFVLQNAVADS